MGTCSCGNTGLFLPIKYCWVLKESSGEEKCLQRFCINCGYIVSFQNERGYYYDDMNMCAFHFKKFLYESPSYKYTSMSKNEEFHFFISDVGKPPFRVNGRFVLGLCNEVNEYRIREKEKLRKAEVERINKKFQKAKNFELAGRFEESALLYEELDMWKEAGDARRTGKSNVSVTKIIQIDANRMFSQIKNEGLAVPYKCPSCSGTLKIDGKNRYDRCPFCGTEIDMKTLSDLVNTLIS